MIPVVPGLAPDTVFPDDGSALAMVLSEVDGSRTADDIVDLTVDRGVTPSEAYSLLNALADRGLVREQAIRVVLSEAVASHDSKPFIVGLRDAGVPVAPDEVPGGLTVFLVDDFRRLNGIPEGRVALVAPFREPAWFGPVFDSATEARCPHCLMVRLRETELSRELSDTAAPGDNLWDSQNVVPTTEIIGAAVEQIRHCSAQSDDPAAVITLSSAGRFTQRIAKQPACPACANPNVVRERLSNPPELPATPKTRDGQRGRSGTERLGELRRHLSPITGIVTRLAGSSRDGVHGFGARHVFATVQNPAGVRTPSIRPHTGGKGATAEAAELAASAKRSNAIRVCIGDRRLDCSHPCAS